MWCMSNLALSAQPVSTASCTCKLTTGIIFTALLALSLKQLPKGVQEEVLRHCRQTCLGTWHSCRQDGQMNLSPCPGPETCFSKHPLQMVWRQGKMQGSVKSARQLGRSMRLSAVPCLLVMLDTGSCKTGVMPSLE